VVAAEKRGEPGPGVRSRTKVVQAPDSRHDAFDLPRKSGIGNVGVVEGAVGLVVVNRGSEGVAHGKPRCRTC